MELMEVESFPHIDSKSKKKEIIKNLKERAGLIDDAQSHSVKEDRERLRRLMSGKSLRTF